MKSRFARWLSVGLVVAGFALVGAPREAHAVLVLTGTITVDANPPITVYASDNNSLAAPFVPDATHIVLADTDPTVGVLTLAPGTIVPGYSVASSSSFDSKTLGNNNLNSNALQIVNTTGSTVTTNIVVSDTNFVGPANLATTSASGTFLNAAGTTYNVFFYNDPTNTQVTAVGAILGLIDSHIFPPIGGGTASVSYNSPAPIVVNDPSLFAMSLRFNFALVTGGTFVSRGQNEMKTLAIVPEPATIALAFSGLPVLGLFYARRRRQQA